MIVVDASVVVDFLLGRATTVAVVEDEVGDRAHVPLHAPEVVELEVLDVLRRMRRSSSLGGERADQAVAELAEPRIVRHAHAPLRRRVWSLRDELTAYDASYLALAEMSDARLLTADAGLGQRAARLIGDDAVRIVA